MRYAVCMSEQIAVRIPDELAESLEDLVASGRFETKADAVRRALETLVDAERRRRVGEQIADGYRRFPQEDEEVASATRAAIRSIHEEPW
jgi:Arc/MetJ-type ribon-helix-helix transcriptional regulator